MSTLQPEDTSSTVPARYDHNTVEISARVEKAMTRVCVGIRQAGLGQCEEVNIFREPTHADEPVIVSVMYTFTVEPDEQLGEPPWPVEDRGPDTA